MIGSITDLVIAFLNRVLGGVVEVGFNKLVNSLLTTGVGDGGVGVEPLGTVADNVAHAGLLTKHTPKLVDIDKGLAIQSKEFVLSILPAASVSYVVI